MQRGRKSAESQLAVISIGAARPSPPERLNSEQSKIWNDVTGRLPADFFPTETRHMLEAYCQHVATARMLSAELNRWSMEWCSEDDGLARFAKLRDLRAKETAAMRLIATSLRISNQARTDSRTAGTKAKDAASKLDAFPWEDS